MKFSHPLDPELLPEYDPEFVEVYNRIGIDQPTLSDLTPQELRQLWTDKLPMLDHSTVASVTDYSYGDSEEQKIRVIVPKAERPSSGWPVYVFYHGGGWIMGNLSFENDVLGRLANLVQCVSILVNYRHAPESPFPAAADDAWAAFEYIQANGDKLGLDLSKVIVGGPSAGANLTEIVTQRLVAHNEKSSTPYKPLVHQVLTVPSTDIINRGKYHSYVKYANSATLRTKDANYCYQKYLQDDSVHSDIRASPLLNDDSVFAKLPPATVIIAEMDPLSDEGREYARKMERNGVKVDVTVLEGVPHAFMVYPIAKAQQFEQTAGKAIYTAIHGRPYTRSV
uniref:ARAD1C15268p n=1 Tax=Blastobotrys adeninivorans TaxID=409370 RepID=A0A060T0B8_BLAAD